MASNLIAMACLHPAVGVLLLLAPFSSRWTTTALNHARFTSASSNNALLMQVQNDFARHGETEDQVEAEFEAFKAELKVLNQLKENRHSRQDMCHCKT